jgi:hypothetical protein
MGQFVTCTKRMSDLRDRRPRGRFTDKQTGQEMFFKAVEIMNSATQESNAVPK